MVTKVHINMQSTAILNMRFGKLVVISEPFPMWSGRRYDKYVRCQCDCGNLKAVIVSEVRSGHVKSCGCLKMEKLINRSTKHGKARHPLYPVWYAMKDRCYNPKSERYSDYGGRGIGICKEWRNSFLCFYDWCIAEGWQKGLQVDRIINDGNYEPSNCRIVASVVNNNNKGNHILISYKGRTQNLAQWAKELNVEYGMLLARMKKHNPSPENLFEVKNRYWKHKANISDGVVPPVNNQNIDGVEKLAEAPVVPLNDDKPVA